MTRFQSYYRTSSKTDGSQIRELLGNLILIASKTLRCCIMTADYGVLQANVESNGILHNGHLRVNDIKVTHSSLCLDMFDIL